MLFRAVVVLLPCASSAFAAAFVSIGFGVCTEKEVADPVLWTPCDPNFDPADQCHGPPVIKSCDQNVYAFPTLAGLWNTPKSWVTASTLDNVLVPSHNHKAGTSAVTVPVTVFDPFSAKPITEASREQVLNKMGERLHQADVRIVRSDSLRSDFMGDQYQTTDHAYLLVETPGSGDAVLVVNLDNSERANKYGFPAATRIPAICEHVKSIYARWEASKSGNARFMVTFLEGCRRSFDHRGEEVSWAYSDAYVAPMIERIEEVCDVRWLRQDVRNNIGPMSFCLATFEKRPPGAAKPEVEIEVTPHQLLSGGHGSVAAQLRFASGHESVWVVALPLDLSPKEGLTVKALRQLTRLMKEDPSTVCAVGDLNSIAGINMDSLVQAMHEEGLTHLLDFKTPTYFGAYFDLVPEF